MSQGYDRRAVKSLRAGKSPSEIIA